MFVFGLFSTHIPYIILTVLYVLGYGAYSIKSAKNSNEDNLQNEKIINYSPKANSGIQGQAKSYFFHQGFQKSFKSGSLDILKQNFSNLFSRKNKLVQELNNGFPNHLEFSLFSRPPPII